MRHKSGHTLYSAVPKYYKSQLAMAGLNFLFLDLESGPSHDYSAATMNGSIAL
jgi:hypothetical protein